MSWWVRAAMRSRGLLPALAGTMILTAIAAPTAGASLAGAAGTDTSIPATASQVTVNGRGEFANLKITVNQTKNLVNQAISVGWTGGQPSIATPVTFSGHYLQIMQCWGDDDGTVAGNPGPPPEQCVQGATSGVFGGSGDPAFPPQSLTTSRVVTRRSWPNYDPAQGALDQKTGNVWKPFRAVDGTVVGVGADSSFDPNTVGGNFWLNPYFNIITTNEIAGGRTGPNGSGAELFEVNTGEESSGLGCGLKVQPVAASGTKIPQCWLVIVPRGTPKEENVGTTSEDTTTQPVVAEQTGVVTSPLSANAWKNRIAIPLAFNPLDSPCALSAEQRQVGGNELPVLAISSWQPTLCTMAGRPPYSYGVISDNTARLQLQNNAPGSPGMVIVSQPFGPSVFPPTDPVTYAPITLSGAVIGFNVERTPLDSAPADSKSLAGVRVADINLTPRLIAKLLTQSYGEQVKVEAATPPNTAWLRGNPDDMAQDPDFLQFNPEFSTLRAFEQRNFSGLVLPLGNSDLAQQVWQYVLADPEAKAWLAGAPDPYGMKVNPVYATKASANSTGVAFGDPVATSFPKSDPFCYQAAAFGPGNSIVPPPICGNVWMPYATSLHAAAQETRVANDGAKIDENTFAQSADQVWKAVLPQRAGSQSILSLTDSASAALYGIQTANLSRAGDDGSTRRFIAPDSAGLLAGVAAMKAKAVPSVLEPDPTASAPAAYPLTTLSYAAIAPLSQDAKARADYAAFVSYAAGPGQVSGLQLGQLPRGYTPLPSALQAQSAAAAKTILNLTSTPATTMPTTSPPQTSPPISQATPYVAPVASASSSSGVPTTTLPSAPPTSLATRAVTTTIPGPVQKVVTPVTAVASTRFVMPGLLGVALLAGLGALEITKRPRHLLKERAASRTHAARPPKGLFR